MRNLTDHIVSADLPQSQLLVTVNDEPGQGNACHEYEIVWPSAPSEDANSFKANSVRISFQDGPIGEVGMNGITQEALLAVVIDRLRGFQGGQYSCRENAIALTHCEDALMWLQKRTRDRLARGVEGTNQK